MGNGIGRGWFDLRDLDSHGIRAQLGGCMNERPDRGKHRDKDSSAQH
jgi:hypothetical protein